MKKNNVKSFLTILTIFILIFSTFALAQTPTSIITDTSLGTSSESILTETIDPGITPDSIFHNLELTIENVQIIFAGTTADKAELSAEFTQERIAELNVMVQQENYEGLKEAIEEAHDDIQTLNNYVEQIEKTEENIELINNLEKQAILNEDHIEEVYTDLEQKVQTQEITTETFEGLNLDTLEGDFAQIQETAEQTKDATADSIAQEQDITQIEAEIQIEKIETEQGLTQIKETEVKEEIVDLGKSIDEIEAKYEELTKTGELENDAEIKHIIEECKTDYQISKDGYKHENIDQAFEYVSSVKSLITKAEQSLNGELSGVEIEEVIEQIEEDKAELNEKAEEFIEEYEENREELRERYPDRFEEFEYDAEKYEKINVINEKIEEESRDGKIYEELKEEGKTEEEIQEFFIEKFAEEYRTVYGEEFLPPGFTKEEEEIDPGSVIYTDEQRENFKSIGGFIEDHEYEDPATGYKYEFTKDGYKYITSLGLTYSESYPEGYEAPKGYEEGNEVHSYIEKTDEGSRIYNYFATGYEVVEPDGAVETFSYPEGKYEVHGGGEVEIESTGFEVTTEGGEEKKYDYNPKFENYVSKDGTTFTPTEGAALHHEAIEYSKDSNSYLYTSSGESWVYDPGANTWTSSNGQTYKPESTTLAPVGFEHQGEFTTQSGEEWTYEESTGTWKSATTGESYTPGTHEYKSSEGESWSYDSTTNTWKSPTGETHEGSTNPTSDGSSTSWTFDPATGSWSNPTTTGTESWSYDPATASWTSSTGESHSGPAPGSETAGYTSGDTSYSGDGGTPH